MTAGRLAGFAWRPVGGIAGLVATVLLAVSGRYGYHRDELYFLACGRHLAWGYPDQPPLVPLIARLMSDLDAGSLVAGALAPLCGTLRLAGHLNNELGISDQEQGAPVWVCTRLRRSWQSSWPGLRELG